MPKRRHILLVLVFGALVVAFYAILSGSREPSYKGRSLSSWLKAYDPHKLIAREREAADEAMRAMGTNVLPRLLWDISKEAAWKMKVVEAVGNGPIAPAVEPWLLRDSEDASRALTALKSLGTNANTGAPALGRVLVETRNRLIAERTTFILAILNTEEAVQALASAVTNQKARYRERGVSMLAIPLKDSSLAVPALVQCLKDPDPSMRQAASNALFRIAPDTLTIVPPQIIQCALCTAIFQSH